MEEDGISSSASQEADMNKDRYPVYAVAAVAGAAIAIWAGVPPYFLLVLACPVMMLFMMGSMSHGNERHDGNAPRNGERSRSETPTLDGSHGRIDQR